MAELVKKAPAVPIKKPVASRKDVIRLRTEFGALLSKRKNLASKIPARPSLEALRPGLKSRAESGRYQPDDPGLIRIYNNRVRSYNRTLELLNPRIEDLTRQLKAKRSELIAADVSVALSVFRPSRPLDISKILGLPRRELKREPKPELEIQKEPADLVPGMVDVKLPLAVGDSAPLPGAATATTAYEYSVKELSRYKDIVQAVNAGVPVQTLVAAGYNRQEVENLRRELGKLPPDVKKRIERLGLEAIRNWETSQQLGRAFEWQGIPTVEILRSKGSSWGGAAAAGERKPQEMWEFGGSVYRIKDGKVRRIGSVPVGTSPVPPGEFILGMIPVVGTWRNWNRMSDLERKVSIGADALFLALPFLGLGVRATAGTVTKTVARAANPLVRTQSQYVGRLREIERLNRALSKAGTGEVRASIQNSLRIAREEAYLLETRLRTLTEKYSQTVRGKLYVDDPTLLERLPNRVVEYSKWVASSQPSSASKIGQEIKSVERALKFAVDPEHSAQLRGELLRLRSGLAVSRAQRLEAQVQEINENIAALQKLRDRTVSRKLLGSRESLVTDLPPSFKYRNVKDLERALTERQRLYNRLGEQYRRIKKSWPEDPLSRGRGREPVRVRPITERGTGGRVVTTTRGRLLIAPTMYAVTGIRTITKPEPKTVTIPAPIEIPTPRIVEPRRLPIEVPLRTPEEIPEPAPWKLPAPVEIPSPIRMPTIDAPVIRPVGIPGIEPTGKAEPITVTTAGTRVEPEIKPEPTTETSPYVPPTRIPTPTRIGRPTDKVPGRIVRPPYSPRKYIRVEGRIIPRRGTVAWRQGVVWIVIYPPYRQGNIIWTDEPPKGIKRVSGPRSAYKTITRLNGEVPKSIVMQLGMFDVEIIRGKRLRYTKTLKGVRL